MPRDILSEYGPDKPMHEKPRATGGGHMPVRDVMNYKPPTGPSNINDSCSPGLHGSNHGNSGTQGKHSGGGRESGRPGIGGDNHGHGTQRRG